MLALGLALLVGDGAAAGFNIALGKGDKKQANRNIGNLPRQSFAGTLKFLVITEDFGI